MKITTKALKRIIQEELNLVRESWGSYSSVDGDAWSDVLIASPNGDSILVDGQETYPEDVTQNMQFFASKALGVEVPPVPADEAEALSNRLSAALENYDYIESSVSYNPRDGWKV
jgi:hypothetical protein